MFIAQQIAAWRASCIQANALMSAKRERAETRARKQQIKTLERELRRKDKALAEAAALLVLEKSSRQRSRRTRAKDRPGAATHREPAHLLLLRLIRGFFSEQSLVELPVSTTAVVVVCEPGFAPLGSLLWLQQRLTVSSEA